MIRSECVTCGDPAADPPQIGWVDPATGAYTAGAVPADAGPCSAGCSCSPSISTTPLCRPDGTSVLVVVRSDCTDCDAPSPDPAVVGWIDPGTGAFTPGPAPADVIPCDALSCVDTLCRQRCDDTNGDGQADAVYSELWCVRQDGSAALLLTYQDDPSTPYTPTAPVDCTYGSVETETVMLCDASGPFLRRYTFLGDTATYVDVDLDGMTPHVVTGTVGACDTPGSGEQPCAEQTTPTATLGLCLADGTPIAVVLTRDCDGTVTQDGWLNLTTGTYSAGAPPVGAAACGDSRAFELAGLLCDIDPATGDVHALVLVEYAYNADGSLASVQLLNPADGTPYVLQGELHNCPTGQAQPDSDLVVLCDVHPDGTATPFVRDYRRDENNLIVGHTDYTLSGAPYVPSATGTVGVCAPEAEPCRNTSTLLLCDLPTDGAPDPTVTDTPSGPYYPYTTGVATAGAQTLWDGGTLTLPAAPGPQPGTCGDRADPRRGHPGPAAGLRRRYSARHRARRRHPARPRQRLPRHRVPRPLHQPRRRRPGSPRAHSARHPRRVDRNAHRRGRRPSRRPRRREHRRRARLRRLRRQRRHLPAAAYTAWQLAQFGATVTYDQTGCATQFLRNVTTDCETGAVTAVVDTTMDGQPYTLTGQPGQCTAAGGGSCCPEQPCTAQNVIEQCRCDDTDGDGLPDAAYVELLAVDCQGTVTSLGTYTDGLAAPYTPVAPVDCDAIADDEGADPALGVQARRVELAAGASWNAAAVAGLQSVTAVAHGGTGTVTTADGASTLHTAEAATWSVARDADAALTGPLTITADTGTVTITWTQGVTL